MAKITPSIPKKEVKHEVVSCIDCSGLGLDISGKLCPSCNGKGTK